MVVQLRGVEDDASEKHVLDRLGSHRFFGFREKYDFHAATLIQVCQLGNSHRHKRIVGHSQPGFIPVLTGGTTELIEPRTNHPRHGGPHSSAIGLKRRASGEIRREQALHQSGRQGCRRQQHTTAQQPGPVSQTRQRRQVFHAEVIDLVQYQVAGQQAQHRRDLMAAARRFDCWHQVIDGAHQHGRFDQFLRIAVAMARAVAVREPIAQRAFGQHTVVDHIAIVGQQFCGRFAAFSGDGLRHRLAYFCLLLLLALEQLPHGHTAHHDGERIVVQLDPLAKGHAGLQREGAQAQCHGETRTPRRVCQPIQDAAVAQCFARARGGHVDAEKSLHPAFPGHGHRQIERLVLPGKCGVGGALGKAFGACQAGQVFLKSGQHLHDAVRALLDADQMLVEALFEPPLTVGVGIDVVSSGDCDPTRIVAWKA